MTKQDKNPSDDDTPSLVFWYMLLDLRYRYMTRDEILRIRFTSISNELICNEAETYRKNEWQVEMNDYFGPWVYLTKMDI